MDFFFRLIDIYIYIYIIDIYPDILDKVLSTQRVI